MKNDLCSLSATDLVRAYSKKQLSPVEVTRAVLRRIETLNPILNAFCFLDSDFSLKEARQSEKRWGKGSPQGLLDGVPVSIKDLLLTRGWPTLRGSKTVGPKGPWNDDAPVVARLREHGAVLLGKTTTPEFGWKGVTDGPLTGITRNPWNPKMTPGGSSGGGAAAVASGMGPLTVGTDGGGSIRIPCSFTGLFGLKPSFGRVPAWPLSPMGTVAHVGPMSRTVADTALLMNVLSLPDTRDWHALPHDGRDYRIGLDDGVKGLRIGVPKEFFGEGLQPDVEQAVREALAEYVRQGAVLVDISLPNAALGIPVYYVIAPAECSSNLSRFDGVRFGHRAAHYGDLDDMIKKSRAEGFGPEPRRRILIGAYVLSHGYYDAYYVQAQKVRRIIADEFQQAFRQCDIIAGPVTTSVAFGFGEKAADPVAMYLSDLYTIPGSLAGIPGMSIPCGFGAKNRPVGLQLMSNYFEEAKLLGVAHQYQLATDWHRRIPKDFA